MVVGVGDCDAAQELAAAAVGAIVLQPSGHPAGIGIQLADWTVAEQTDGTVELTIRELRNPNGLQRALPDDGVPASIMFENSSNAQPNPCESYGHPGMHRLSRRQRAQQRSQCALGAVDSPKHD